MEEISEDEVTDEELISDLMDESIRLNKPFMHKDIPGYKNYSKYVGKYLAYAYKNNDEELINQIKSNMQYVTWGEFISSYIKNFDDNNNINMLEFLLQTKLFRIKTFMYLVIYV